MSKKEFVNFIRFLKANQILPRYIKNCHASINSIDKFLNTNIDLMVSGGFTWASTPEGNDFWFQKNIKWLEFLRKNKYR